ncbi:ARMT1-like domain-containing protein [Helicobacter sp. faydin-H20]|uniref:damage-control phosphatase ARMT1 family protein n=1 Tax=Helicobacter anatolicus TaxID=2905874 RepID=UPI001E5A7118|nr:ARMT1-like domain-containing protein [Helicobacter anatolicus]MCE3036541.1 ARMT1-like domain-containing protein [Helicobacter anatolicus]
MNATPKCHECIYNQIKNTLQLFPHQEEQKILQQTSLFLRQSPSCPPPKIAYPIYKNLAKITKKEDIYAPIKESCIKKAYEITQELRKKLQQYTQTNLLEESIKIAALGNVIDYGSQTQFSFDNFDSKLDFAIFDLPNFQERLQNTSTLLYLADNAGENLFDAILIENLKKLYPSLNILYLTRGKPIINDLTFKDITENPLCTPIAQFCTPIDSTMQTPGFLYEDAPQHIQQLFNQADLILAKGMGNFECLESHKKDNLFFLFKIKCQVVSDFLKIPLGKMIFKQNKA